MVEVDPGLKKELYVELARRDLTLKAWFVDNAQRLVEAGRQPSLFPEEEAIYRSQEATREPTPPETEGSE